MGITPSTRPEYICCIGIMLVGSVFWATIIGEIVSVIRNSNMDEVQHMQKMDQLLLMGREFNLSRDLQGRLKAFMTQSREVLRTNFIQENLIGKMSPELAMQMTEVIHGKWLEKVWWLRKVARGPFMVELTLAFDPMLYCPNEFIVTTDRLFVIMRGIAVRGFQIISKGNCWGMDMLLTQSHLRMSFATVAMSYLHVLYITRKALLEILNRWPREKVLVRRAYVALTFMRGIVYQANVEKRKRRKEAEERGQLPPEPERPKKTDFISQMSMISVEAPQIDVHPTDLLADTIDVEEERQKHNRSIQELCLQMSHRVDDVEHRLAERMRMAERKVESAARQLSVLTARKKKK